MINDLQPNLPILGELDSTAKVKLGVYVDYYAQPHVLLAEDYFPNILIATILLEQFGCTCMVAKNGQEALDLMKSEIFDLVFMDVQMPVMDGLTATSLIRIWEQEHGKPRNNIIGVTARALVGDREECLNAGMSDYMSKPYQPDEFHAKIKKYAKVQAAQIAAA